MSSVRKRAHSGHRSPTATSRCRSARCYGANKVRFPSPVPVGSRLRLGVKLLEVKDVAGGAEITLEFTFEVEGATKPSCVAEIIFRLFA